MPYLAPTAHANPLATLHRERLLPLAGQVTAEVNQRVEPADVVARTHQAERHVLVDVARRLGVSPDEADAAMLKKDGDEVKQGEPLARRPGRWRWPLRSPVAGRLVAAADGKALLAAYSQPLELRAGVPGTIVNVLAGRGVVIETTGALLEAVWGNGKQDSGSLRLLGDDPRLELTPARVDTGLRGAIVAAGILRDKAALKQLGDVRVRGLVVGTAAASLLAQAQQLPFPVLVVDGFGSGGFSSAALALLSANAGREAWLNAEMHRRFDSRRPELIVPLPSPGTPPPPVQEGQALAAGQRVRVLRGAQAGQVGTVVDLSERAVPIASGLRSRVARVALAGAPDAPAQVPLANLEILE